MESEVVAPIWSNWEGVWIKPSKHPTRNIINVSPKVKVLPGNPSLPLRVMFRELSVRRNGGVDGSELGIDLSIRGHEVRKLFYAGGFTSVLIKEHIDPEEVLQEVYRGLLARNKGTCPWDVTKSSFGHYVHIVIQCVLANYLRKERRRSSIEGVSEDGEVRNEAIILLDGDDDFVREDLLKGLYRDETERQKVREFLMMLEAGLSRREAVERLGGTAAWGDSVIRTLRGVFGK